MKTIDVHTGRAHHRINGRFSISTIDSAFLSLSCRTQITSIPVYQTIFQHMQSFRLIRRNKNHSIIKRSQTNANIWNSQLMKELDFKWYLLTVSKETKFLFFGSELSRYCQWSKQSGFNFWRFGEGAKPNFGQKLKTFLPFQSEMTSIIIILLVTEMLRARAEKPPKIAKHREHRLPLDASCNQLQRKVDRR